jgi:hypothetical protein
MRYGNGEWEVDEVNADTKYENGPIAPFTYGELLRYRLDSQM